ncbi:MAG: hypothetical protein R3B93_16030 [Bacteroidia bacterium]
MIAAYQSLTGVDAYYWFAVTSKAYMEDPYFSWHTYEDGQHPMNRWTCSFLGSWYVSSQCADIRKRAHSGREKPF